jgi:hypothetical protein
MKCSNKKFKKRRVAFQSSQLVRQTIRTKENISICVIKNNFFILFPELSASSSFGPT